MPSYRADFGSWGYRKAALGHDGLEPLSAHGELVKVKDCAAAAVYDTQFGSARNAWRANLEKLLA